LLLLLLLLMMMMIVSDESHGHKQITYAPTEAGISVDSVSAQLGYFQVWLEASGDLDLSLQFYSGGAWNTLATSSGSTGTEWIQFSTKGS